MEFCLFYLFLCYLQLDSRCPESTFCQKFEVLRLPQLMFNECGREQSVTFLKTWPWTALPHFLGELIPLACGLRMCFDLLLMPLPLGLPTVLQTGSNSPAILPGATFHHLCHPSPISQVAISLFSYNQPLPTTLWLLFPPFHQRNS